MTAHPQLITCDACQKDITATRREPSFRIHLSSMYMQTAKEGTVLLIEAEDPLPEHKHFCDLFCLGNWLANQPPSAKNVAKASSETQNSLTGSQPPKQQDEALETQPRTPHGSQAAHAQPHTPQHPFLEE